MIVDILDIVNLIQWILDGGSYEGYADATQDGNIDILDIVMIIGYILETTIFSDTQICISDRNQDSDINVLDVVMLIGDILNV